MTETRTFALVYGTEGQHLLLPEGAELTAIRLEWGKGADPTFMYFDVRADWSRPVKIWSFNGRGEHITTHLTQQPPNPLASAELPESPQALVRLQQHYIQQLKAINQRLQTAYADADAE